jgi:hypothetical protein
VYPSAGARTTASVAILLAAPGRFSTIIEVRQVADHGGVGSRLGPTHRFPR